MTDTLARLAPLARQTLHDVDAILFSHLPPRHRVLRLLAEVGTGPGELVATVAEWEPGRLRAAAAQLRTQAQSYGLPILPADLSWEGGTATTVARTITALGAHVTGGGATGAASGTENLVDRLRATASFAERMADWQQDLRDALARALAEVSRGEQVKIMMLPRVRPGDPGALTAAIDAAAHIGALVLGVAEDAALSGRALIRAAPSTDELTYRPPQAGDPTDWDGPIRLR